MYFLNESLGDDKIASAKLLSLPELVVVSGPGFRTDDQSSRRRRRWPGQLQARQRRDLVACKQGSNQLKTAEIRPFNSVVACWLCSTIAYFQ